MLRMLGLALQFELLGVVRHRAAALAILAYLAVGGLAILLGQRHTAEWTEALQAAQQEEQESAEAARRALASGEPLPERNRVDLGTAWWQDHEAGTRVLREPSGLAGIASSSVDPLPVAVWVWAHTNPLSVGGTAIENPELAAGSVDVVFVLSILTPLLVGVLGLGIGGREREEQIDRLIVVHSGAIGEWLLARAVAVTTIAAICAASLALAAGLLGSATGTELMSFVGFAVAYTVLWGGLLAAVGATAHSVRGGALAFGALWTALCVLGPTLTAEMSLSRVEADFLLTDTVDARAENWEVWEQSPQDVLSQIYAMYPELEDLPGAAKTELGRQRREYVTLPLQVEEWAKRFEELRAQTGAAQRVAETAAWLSPPVALTLVLERLAGAGPEAALSYQTYLFESVRERNWWRVKNAWTERELGQEDFEALVAGAPAPFRWDPKGLGQPTAAMTCWMSLAWLLAIVLFRRTAL